jgi:hypothetical protein
LKTTTYTDRKSGYECLLVELELGKKTVLVGASYDPRSTADPVPWHGGCRHCTLGLVGSPLPIQVRRLVQVLLSRRRRGFIPQHGAPVYEYSVPTNREPCRLRCWQTPAAKRVELTTADRRRVSATLESDGELHVDSEVHLIDFKIISRTVNFVLSSRTSPPSEVLAVTSSMKAPKTHWHANPCNTIEWGKIRELAKFEEHYLRTRRSP